jgi:hypothetical protein
LVTDPDCAVRVTVCGVATGLVDTVKVVEVWPPAKSAPYAWAAAVLLLVIGTSRPQPPVGFARVMIPVTVFPPTTDVASKLSDARFGRMTSRIADSEYGPLIAVIR